MSNESLQTCENACESANAASEATWVKPSYRAEKVDATYRVRIFMPGVTRTGVNVSVEKDVLTIEGIRSDSVDESWKPVFQEIRSDGYRLQLHLNVDIDADKIEATVRDGVLNLVLPIAEAAKPRTITVS